MNDAAATGSGAVSLDENEVESLVSHVNVSNIRLLRLSIFRCACFIIPVGSIVFN